MTIFVGRHKPDPVDMEPYWAWHCTCGDASDDQFITREDAQDDADKHRCVPE